MSTSPVSSADAVNHELAHLRNQWWWFLLLGIAMILLGTAAIAVPPLFTDVAVLVLGVLLIVGGIGQIISSFWVGRWSGFFVSLLTGILYTVVGFLMVDRPLVGAAALTLLLAAFFIVTGIFKIIVCLHLKFHNWGWALLNGVVTLLLGIIIWSQLPTSVLWVIGLLIGIEMLFNGWAWVMMGLSVRHLPER